MGAWLVGYQCWVDTAVGLLCVDASVDVEADSSCEWVGVGRHCH